MWQSITVILIICTGEFPVTLLSRLSVFYITIYLFLFFHWRLFGCSLPPQTVIFFLRGWIKAMTANTMWTGDLKKDLNSLLLLLSLQPRLHCSFSHWTSHKEMCCKQQVLLNRTRSSVTGTGGFFLFLSHNKDVFVTYLQRWSGLVQGLLLYATVYLFILYFQMPPCDVNWTALSLTASPRLIPDEWSGAGEMK